MADFTYKQRMFIHYYTGVSAGNATDAARRAGYAWPDKQGLQQLAKPSINEACKAKVTECALSADEVLSRLAEHSAFDPADYYVIDDFGRTTIDLKKIKRDGKGHLIKRIRNSKFGVEVEFHDQQAALNLLGKFHNLFNDRQAQPEPAREFPELVEVRDVSRNGSNGAANGHR